MTGVNIEELRVTYRTDNSDVTAVDGVTLSIGEQEIIGVVGESGCGKSTLAASITGLLDGNAKVTDGSIRYDGTDITTLTEAELTRDIRGPEIGMISQHPHASLDPVFTVGEQVVETLLEHRPFDREKCRARAIELLDEVGIPTPKERFDDYPHQLSGGMKQRVIIAIVLSCNPGLLIADEPTTALDVTIQAQILSLLRDLHDKHGSSILFITHDLGVVAEICDRVAVMYAGQLVEVGPVQTVFESPKHPYTQSLLAALPRYHDSNDELSVIEGSPPDLSAPPEGCRYHPRCDQICSDACETRSPPMYEEQGSQVRCYLYDEAENPAYDGQTAVSRR